MKVRVSDDAERDLAHGISFYDRHGVEVGNHFRDSILADLQALSVLGGVHAKRFGYHCMSAKRFPYAIYYMTDDTTVSVVGILDERRDPAWIQQRLNRS